MLVEPDNDVMNVCAQLRADCERVGPPLGQKIHEADPWIAATAMKRGVELVSDDAMFCDASGLVVINGAD